MRSIKFITPDQQTVLQPGQGGLVHATKSSCQFHVPAALYQKKQILVLVSSVNLVSFLLLTLRSFDPGPFTMQCQYDKPFGRHHGQV